MLGTDPFHPCKHGKYIVCVECIKERPISPAMMKALKDCEVRSQAEALRRSKLTPEELKRDDERIRKLAYDLAQFDD